MSTQRITTSLWFDTQAVEAAEFYCSIFEDSRIVSAADYPAGTDNAGTPMVVEWEMLGQRFTAINGGPQFPFTEAISLAIECVDQEEIDHYWELLTDGGGGGPVRLVQGPLRAVMAGQAGEHEPLLDGRPGGSGADRAGHVRDAQARHRRAGGGRGRNRRVSARRSVRW